MTLYYIILHYQLASIFIQPYFTYQLDLLNIHYIYIDTKNLFLFFEANANAEGDWEVSRNRSKRKQRKEEKYSKKENETRRNTG